MAKELYNDKINKTTDWGGDESTGFLPVSGARIQEFIKGQLEGKAGYFYYDSLLSRVFVFADEANKDAYLADPTKEELLIAMFDAPSNYTANIDLKTPMYNAVSKDSVGNDLDFTFDVVNKSGAPTGESVICTYTFRRGSITKTVVEQYTAGKQVHFNIDKYLEEGNNQITISVQGVNTLAATSIGVTFQVVALSLSSDYDVSQVYNLSDGAKTLTFPYHISGQGAKTLEWYLDGTKLDFVKDEDEVLEVTPVDRTKYITLSALSEGVHSLQVRASVSVEGELFYSDVLYADIMIHNGVSATPLAAIYMIAPEILSTRTLYGMTELLPYTLRFATYSPTTTTSVDVTIKLNDEIKGSLTSKNNNINEITIIPTISGNATLSLELNGYTHIINVDIADKTINLAELTNGLQLDFRAVGKANNATDKDRWSYGDYTGTFEGFKWNDASGWVDNSLLVSAGASFGIDLAPLANNPALLGKTIELEFASTNVNDDEAVLCDLTDSNGTGILITASKVKLTSANNKVIETDYKDNEFNRIAFVINKNANTTNKCMSFIYVNGIVSRGISWLSTDSYTNSKQILFTGSSDAEVKIRAIRIYDIALTHDQILNNYMLYQNNVSDMTAIYDRNNIYGENSSQFDYEKMMGRLPVMIITGDVPALEATSDKNLQITVDVEYHNLQDNTKSFTMESAALRPQGTSSMGYPKKNFRLYTQKRDDTIVKDYTGKVVENKLYSFKEGAQPVNCWCMKADYAESSGTHNTGIARLWNQLLIDATINGDYVFRTQAQKAANQAQYEYDVRTTIDGFPILMFYRLTYNDPLVFIGKYNFNNDKSTESVFGFEGIPGFDNSKMQCWEILNNGNALALFTTINNFDRDWEEAFESRYPDTKTPYLGDLKAFCTWMSAFPTTITDESVTTFSEEKYNHLDVYKIAAYYVYLMRFGAVDQTVKNAMFTSEDGEHFYYINYDNDTINGLLNTGYLKVTPYATRQTIGEQGEPYYAGRDSNLWNYLEADDDFLTIVKEVDQALYVAGLRYDNVIDMFDNQQADKWVERVYNQDAQYKYIGPFAEKGTDNLFMLQGNRSIHRKWWLAKRFNFFDSKYVSGAYKSNAIELKCLDNTAAGQSFTVTAGEEQDYGYGINNLPRVINISLTEGLSHTFTTTEKINQGDPVRIYGANNIAGLDLSAMASRLFVVSIDKVYDASTGSKFKSLIVGNPDVENTVLPTISGINLATRLEYLDIQNMKAMTDLSLANQLNIKTVKAGGSSLTGITFAKGAALETLELPKTIQTLVLDSMPNLSSIIYPLDYNNPSGASMDLKDLTSLTIKDCPTICQDFDFIYTWYNNLPLLENGEVTLIMEGVNWNNISASQLIEIGSLGNENGQGINNISLKGKAVVDSITEEQANTLMNIYGTGVFNMSSDFYISAPDSLFVLGPEEMVEGGTLQLTAAVFSNYPGTVTWTIESGGVVNQQIDFNTGLLTVADNKGNRAIVVQAKHTPTLGRTTYATKQIKILKSVRATGGTLEGSDVIYSDSTYSLALTTSGINKPYTVAWNIDNANVEGGVIRWKESGKDSITIQFPEATNVTGTFTIDALVTNDDGTSFSATKDILIGIAITLKVESSEGDSDPVINQARVTFSYENYTYTIGNGESIAVPKGTGIYIVPGFMTGYEKINSEELSFADSYVYTIRYIKTVGTMIIIDQNISDPATMISGDVNGYDIQQIRNNSHRYLGKYTAEGEMTLCQLDDNDSNYYIDGSLAILTGEEGDVFMKMPTFYYKINTSGMVAKISFYYGDEAPNSDNWIRWEGNYCIGVYFIGLDGNKRIRSVSDTTILRFVEALNYVKLDNIIVKNLGVGFERIHFCAHQMMALLYYAAYGNTNVKKTIGSGRSTTSADVIGGASNSMGMTDTTSSGYSFVNFWGIEDFTGFKGSIVSNNSASYDSNDRTFTFTDLYSNTYSFKLEDVISKEDRYWVSAFSFDNPYLWMVPIAIAGTESTNFCCSIREASASNYILVGSGISYTTNAHSPASILAGSEIWNWPGVFQSTRLCFRGNCIIQNTSELFKALTVYIPPTE